MRTDTGSQPVAPARERESLLGINVHTGGPGRHSPRQAGRRSARIPAHSRAHTGSTTFPGQVREPERVGERASNLNVGTRGRGDVLRQGASGRRRKNNAFFTKHSKLV